MLFNANHLCNIEKRMRKQRMAYTAGTGTPVVGQTVTGATSHSTAKVSRVETGAIVVKDLSAAFTIGEVITTTTLSATLSTVADYKKTDGEYEHYWTTYLTGVRCRFYRTTARILVVTPGVMPERPLKCALPVRVGITARTAIDYMVTTTEVPFAGSYTVDAVTPSPGMMSYVAHLETTLKAVPS